MKPVSEEILQGNRLIAKFLGLEILSRHGRRKNAKVDYKTQIFEDELIYHSSWTMLMKAVEKIESLNIADSAFIIEGNYATLWFKNGEVISSKEWAGTKIQATWNVVIEFIQWLNEEVYNN